MEAADACEAIVDAMRDIGEPWVETREDGKLEMSFQDGSEFVITATRK